MSTQSDTRSDQPEALSACADRREPGNEERELLRLVSEQRTMSVDQAARLLGAEEAVVAERVAEMCDLGWLVVRRFAGSPRDWIWLCRAGARHAGTGFGCEAPRAPQLEHQAAVNEVRIAAAEAYPGGTWVCERELWAQGRGAGQVPDGLVRLGPRRIAVEVELTRKTLVDLQGVVAARMSEYDEVVYYCAERCVQFLERVREELDVGDLVIRPLPEVRELQGWKRRIGPRHAPSEDERVGLRLISEEGIVAVSELGSLLGIEPEFGYDLARRLEERNFVRRVYEVEGDGGWLLCTPRANELSGTGLGTFRWVGVGALEGRLRLLRIRATLMREEKDAKWVGRRRLIQGKRGGRRGDVPDAAVERGGKRYGVLRLSQGQPRWGTRKRIESLLREYDGVWCYGDSAVHARVEGLVQAHGWQGVEVRSLPG